MMKTKILSCLAVALLATGAKAQEAAIGPEGGVNISNYTGYSGGQALNTTIQTGVRLGGVVQNSIGHYFFIERGLFYVMNGYHMDVPQGNASARVNTAELPLNFMYKFHENKAGDRVFLGVGPYLAFNLTGRYKISAASVDRALSFGSDNPDDMKIVDFGFGVNGGFQVENGVFIRAHAQMGIVNLKPYGNSDNAIYNTNYGVTIGYLLTHDYSKDHRNMHHMGHRDMDNCHHHMRHGRHCCCEGHGCDHNDMDEHRDMDEHKGEDHNHMH